MKHPHIPFLFLVPFLFSGPAFARGGPGAVLELDWVRAQVARNNPDVKAARALVRAAGDEAKASLSWPDPQLGVEYWQVPRPGLDLGQAVQKQLDFSQTIPFPAKTWLAHQAASQGAREARARAGQVLQQRLLEAGQAYWDLYGACASLRAVSRTLEVLGRLVSISDARNRFGRVDRMGQLMDPMARMQGAELENRMEGLRHERLLALRELDQLMARDPGQALPDPPLDPPPPRAPATDRQALERALAGRAEVRVAQSGLARLRSERSLARAGWWPDLMLQYSAVDMAGMPVGMAMAKVNLPFVWFWRQGSEEAAADRREQASQRDLESARDQTRRMVLDEESAFQSELAQLERVRREIIPEAARARSLGVEGYRLGGVGVSDALNAVLADLAARLQAVGLTAQLGRSRAVLERLMGNAGRDDQ